MATNTPRDRSADGSNEANAPNPDMTGTDPQALQGLGAMPMLQESRQRFPWLGVIGLVVLLGVAGFGGWRFWTARQAATQGAAAQQGGPPQFSVQTETIATQPLQRTSNFVATLEALESVEIRAESEGLVQNIFVEPGQAVASGDPLFLVNPRKQEAEVLASLSVVRSATATRQSIAAQLEAQQAEVAVQDAELELQLEEYSRTSELVAEGALSEQSLDRARSTRDQAQANLNAAQKRVQAITAQLAEIDQTIAGNAAQARVAEETLRETTIRAPFSGVVGDIDVKLGSYVEIAELLTVLVQNDQLKLKTAIPIEFSDRVTLGLPVQVLNAQQQPTARGSVDFIAPNVSSDSQTLLVEARLNDPPSSLRDAQFVRAEVIWETKPNAIIVPSVALVLEGEKRSVYVVEQGQNGAIAKLRPVDVGQIDGDQVEITQGLSPGETIV
ncbi:MAG: efflux RND transporter periplasmic adaptor subunit, partial [Cyanobacteria bacterium P01_H01_bin.121]